MAARGFAHEEHTADLRVRAWGPTLGDAFGEAARGMVAYMVEVDAAPFEREFEVDLRADTLDRLVVAFLEEVLFKLLTDLVVPGRFQVDVRREEGGYALHARVRAAPYVDVKHGHVHEIKAVTFHDLHVRESPPEVSVVLDI